MKPSQFAKGFQARPDITTSEKRTALDRLNAIDGIVKSETPTPAPTKSAKKDIAPLPAAELTLDPSIDESAQYRAWRLENRYAPGQVIELPLKAIKHSPFNPRHFYLKSSIAELAVNLAKQGQQQAIHVIPDYENPGTYFVSDGGRRVRALKEANKESVKAIVIDVPIGIQSYKLGYDLNVQRDSQTVFDNAVVWRRFLDDKHFQSQKEPPSTSASTNRRWPSRCRSASCRKRSCRKWSRALIASVRTWRIRSAAITTRAAPRRRCG